jgi:hypothetical protein
MNEPESRQPKEWVNRLLAAGGVQVADQEADWLGVHLERFLAYCRKHGTVLDLATAVAADKRFLG